MSIKLSKTIKDEILLGKNGFFYHFDKRMKAGNSWRCTNRLCKGRIKTEPTKTFTITKLFHNHSPEKDKKVKHKIISLNKSYLEIEKPTINIFLEVKFKLRQADRKVTN